jgi:hypothetical protein
MFRRIEQINVSPFDIDHTPEKVQKRLSVVVPPEDHRDCEPPRGKIGISDFNVSIS